MTMTFGDAAAVTLTVTPSMTPPADHTMASATSEAYPVLQRPSTRTGKMPTDGATP
jgi:hypothetical protein